MAIESPAAPAVETPSVSPAQAVKPTRARNEYPEAYDQLEELEAGGKSSPEPRAVTPAPKPVTPKPSTEPAPKPSPTTAKPEPKTETPARDANGKTTETAPEKKPEPGEPEGPDPTAKFVTAHDLRKEYRRLHKSLQEREGELTSLRSKAESSPVHAAIMEENKAMKKRLEEVEGELRYVDYTKSAEFKEKFERPYQEAYGDALEEVKELRVNLDDGSTRPATEADFQRIITAETQDVRKLANDLFGEAANDVLAARRRLIELNRNANRESKKYREQAAERERQKTLKTAEEKENMERLWNKANDSIKEKYPEYFGHVEGDDEYNKELDAGYAIVDKAHQPNLPLEEKVARLAALRHRAAAFRAQVLLTKRQKERIAELEKVVQEYEESAPAGGKGGSETARVAQNGDADGYINADAEIEALAKQDTAD